MSQPVANDPGIHVVGTAAGTTIIMAHPGNFNTVTVGTATTGTAIFFNTNVATGTTSANLLMSLTGAVNTFRPYIHLNTGLTAVLSGTIDMLVGAG